MDWVRAHVRPDKALVDRMELQRIIDGLCRPRTQARLRSSVSRFKFSSVQGILDATRRMALPSLSKRYLLGRLM